MDAGAAGGALGGAGAGHQADAPPGVKPACSLDKQSAVREWCYSMRSIANIDQRRLHEGYDCGKVKFAPDCASLVQATLLADTSAWASPLNYRVLFNSKHSLYKLWVRFIATNHKTAIIFNRSNN